MVCGAKARLSEVESGRTSMRCVVMLHERKKERDEVAIGQNPILYGVLDLCNRNFALP